MKKEQAKALITWLLRSPKLKRTSVDGAVIGAPGTYAIRCGHEEWKDAPMYIGTADHAYVVIARAYSKERIYVQSDVLYHDVFTLAHKLLCRKRDTSLGQVKEKTWLDLAKAADPDFAWPSVDVATDTEPPGRLLSDLELKALHNF